MKYCDLTFHTAAENLACDEALLDLCDEGASDELLRFWEPHDYFVVLGYANSATTEVNLPFCRQKTIPVLRRCSGGGTVLQGPGCLNYSLIIRIDESGPCHTIHSTNEFILERQIDALAIALQQPVSVEGQTDLVLHGLKFSGNAQRRKRNFLIFHGTFLLNMDLAMIEQALAMPSRQPSYRAHRAHSDFLTNLNVSSNLLKKALQNAWDANEPFQTIPLDRVSRLVSERYSLEEWNLKFP